MPSRAERLAAELAAARQHLAALQAAAVQLEELIGQTRLAIAAAEEGRATYHLAAVRAGCRIVADERTDEWAAVEAALTRHRR